MRNRIIRKRERNARYRETRKQEKKDLEDQVNRLVACALEQAKPKISSMVISAMQQAGDESNRRLGILEAQLEQSENKFNTALQQSRNSINDLEIKVNFTSTVIYALEQVRNRIDSQTTASLQQAGHKVTSLEARLKESEDRVGVLTTTLQQTMEINTQLLNRVLALERAVQSYVPQKPK